MSETSLDIGATPHAALRQSLDKGSNLPERRHPAKLRASPLKEATKLKMLAEYVEWLFGMEEHIHTDSDGLSHSTAFGAISLVRLEGSIRGLVIDIKGVSSTTSSTSRTSQAE